MAYTQQDLDDIDDIIASGESDVQGLDGRRVTNRPLADLLRTRKLILADLANQDGLVKRSRPGPRCYSYSRNR